ncbi:uncharacterized protein [Rutidosis leptorrhynchoides]|uniref:uncharacterized protein n=1 Tax=Rutidosis leptorrhynchoides TaxID=125765 RepID=UPI003A98FFEA
MEHDQKVSIGSSCDEFPLLSSKYPWFIVQNFIDEQDAIDTEFYSTLHDPLIKYQSQIPELNGKRIRGCLHGWLILSNHPYNTSWSLWNPLTLKIIDLPNLVLYTAYGVSLDECCLTAPPDDPNSILLVTRCDESSIFICRMNSKKSCMRWTQMSYAKQLKELTYDGAYLNSLTCCNGKIYALICDSSISPVVIQVEIVVKDYQNTIQLLMFGNGPLFSYSSSDSKRSLGWANFLKGYGTKLFCISVGIDEKTKKCGDVSLFQLDTASIKSEELECLKKWDLTGVKKMEQMSEDDLKDLRITQVKWEEMNDLNDAIFYVDLGRDWSIFYNPAVDSELGGYIHIRYEVDGILYLYHVKDRTIVVSSMPSQVVSTTRVLMLEGRLEKDESVVTGDAVEHNESRVYNIPFGVYKIILEYCVGVEYLNFRATCKLCHLAAPLIGWRNESSLRRRRWHNYSLNSPCLMVVDKGIVTFIDPLSGDKYFMKNSKLSLSLVEDTIYCSRYGWLLCESREYECPVFFNPFTNDVRKLPVFNNGDVKSLCFSAPPTSSDWIVGGYAIINDRITLIYFVSGKPSWCLFEDNNDRNFVNGEPLFSSIFIGRDLYAMYKEMVNPTIWQPHTNTYIEMRSTVSYMYSSTFDPIDSVILAEVPKSSCSSRTQYFVMNCDEYLLVVIVGEFGEVEVFRRNHADDQWKKTDTIGRHTIYIGGPTSVCVDAKTREMENKIVFPNLVWYSLKTRTYHTFGGKLVNNGFGGFLEAKTHAWIEPSWSKLDVNQLN